MKVSTSLLAALLLPLSSAEANLRTTRDLSSSGKVLPRTPPVQSKDYDHPALLEAYERYGINEHNLQNEMEIFKYATIKPQSESHVHRELENSDTYTITSISPNVIWNDEMVTVSFSTTYPQHDDIIAAYSPVDTEPTDTVPVKYGWCSDFSPQYLTTGQGTLTFNMTNLRSAVRFSYIAGGFSGQHMNTSAAIGDLQYHNINEQLRPRVVPTGDTNEFSVMWSSATNTQPVMKWATTPEGVLSGSAIEVQATTTTVSKDELCGWPANEKGWREMGLIHAAPLHGMEALANTKIYYTFGDKASDDWSRWDGDGDIRVWDFYVPPLPGTQPPNRPTTLVWFDDLGRGSNDEAWTWRHYGRPSFNTTKSVGALVQTGAIDAIYHGGDISYAVGYEAIWDFFMDMLSPMSASVLYFTTVGNHETDFPNTSSFYTGYDSGGECSVTALKMLPQPYTSPGKPSTVNNPWWSYSVGKIHFIGLSSEQNFTKNSDQWLWLEADLKAINRTETPWVLFGAHRAMYLSSSWGPDNDEGEFTPSSDIANMDLMVSNLEPLLWKYKVNLGLYGHMHCVQRQSAILEQQVVQKATMVKDHDGNLVATHDDPQATVHYVVGTGGADLMTSVNPIRPAWNELVFFKWGYAIIEAVSNTELTFKWVDSSNNEVIDRMTITQKDPALESTSSMWECPGAFFDVCKGGTYSPTPAPAETAASGDFFSKHEEITFVLIGVVLMVLIAFGFYKYSISTKQAETRGRSSTVEMLDQAINPKGTEDAIENPIQKMSN
jgi:acid phosphatase type 7